jgi:hypothetical protein
MFETHHLMINAEEDILAISSSETQYNVQLTSTDLLSCHRMNQVFMCDSFGVMSKRFNDTCLGRCTCNASSSSEGSASSE